MVMDWDDPAVYYTSYCKVASNSLSCLEEHIDFFRLSMKGKFDVYLLLPYGKS